MQEKRRSSWHHTVLKALGVSAILAVFVAMVWPTDVHLFNGPRIEAIALRPGDLPGMRLYSERRPYQQGGSRFHTQRWSAERNSLRLEVDYISSADEGGRVRAFARYVERYALREARLHENYGPGPHPKRLFPPPKVTVEMHRSPDLDRAVLEVTGRTLVVFRKKRYQVAMEASGLDPGSQPSQQELRALLDRAQKAILARTH